MIDQEAHDDVLGLVVQSLDGVRLGRDVEEVIAHGRMLRRRRRAAPLALAAGIAAASFGIAMALGGGPAHDDSASFSVSTNPQTGAVEVSVYEFNDPDGLVQALATAGIHAVVHETTPLTVGPCTWTGVTQLHGSVESLGRLVGKDDAEALFLYPAELPKDSVYGISYYVLPVPNSETPWQMYSFTLLSGEPTGCLPQAGSAPVAQVSTSAR